MNLFIKQKQTHRFRKQIYGYQKKDGREIRSLGLTDKSTTINKTGNQQRLTITQGFLFNICNNLYVKNRYIT